MAFQGRGYEKVVPLGVTGLLPGDVTAQYWKTGATAFATKTLTAENFLPLGGGFYIIRWSEAEMSAVGSFYYSLSGPFTTHLGDFDVDPVPLSLAIPPTKCIVSGNIVDLGGQAVDCDITFRVVKVPARAGSSFVTGSILRTDPDALGNFSVSLLRGATALVEIPQAGVRYQFTVPDQETADLMDLLPPLT